ncbi:MAG: DUF560 domain-containing protein [Proteobacteria bacterium]|nr:DUF560 domain-containing protein [Pseudomonadota bacterium]
MNRTPTGTCRYGRAGAWARGALLAFALAAAPAGAQVANPEIAPEMDRAFEQMLRDPADLQLTFNYAGIAARAGNYEGAIAALERMLLIDPDLPRVRLELGVLYYRLESFDLARSYFVSAVAGANVPPEVRSRVAQYMSEIDKRQSRHKVSGSVLAGVRFQTNATSGYGNTLVPIPAIAGTDPVDIGSGKRNDWNLFSAASVNHSYDFGDQSGDTLETGVTLYGTRQNHVHSLNTSVAEINSGPRVSLGDLGLADASLRPYALASLATLKDNRYLHSFGGGLQYQQALAGNVLWSLGYEARAKNYRTDASRRTVRLQNGQEHGFTTGLVYVLTPIDSLSAGAGISSDLARTGEKRIARHNVSAGYTRKQLPPSFLGTEPWTFGLTVGRYISTYRSPDSTIDSNTRRGDFEWRYGTLVGIPLTDTLSFVAVGQRQTVGSSYRINKYRNDSITLGVSWLF